ncbi:hypothetical protein THF1C08_260018 [Vibrio jasicida]|uniref:Uncharacterized protein n=1 Tax=Vibrio jasicida TaxID=766224 RepID=A0AAU9QNK2_9VIBR|nr:hypothetical protein THF1C08_260018 [Vibrio jasicida]CAH1596469.1 hypothetical protein THF1A12_300002 [Vibrio jasicida]
MYDRSTLKIQFYYECKSDPVNNSVEELYFKETSAASLSQFGH